ncbi:SufS family cysteine desulfurase [uncultured Rubinisphaera sp.]|uniref:aminotransferase class V-fold PLP-dependent enzyme n=1 Tax=uncultured Rubinisphaera sp. TaxID=1678686 RepID=UPI0030D81491|tara:strand:- start:5603 stop:6850 length:1248 start_codon:yes stop_codon:yes gene_type:complete
MNFDLPEFDVEAFRKQFPILHQPDSHGRKVIYLDNGASAQKPLVVIDKVVEAYSKYYANAYRGVYEFGQRIDDELELTREAVRSLINAERKEEIVFTPGTTASLNMIAQGYGRTVLKPGDEILLTLMEHHANIVPWQIIAEQTGAIIRYLPLTEDGRLDLEQLSDYLTEKTKFVSVTGMSNVLGTIPNIQLLAGAAHAVGAIIIVDAAQSMLHEPIDVLATGVDFVVFSGHKFYGPTGVGVLYGRYQHLEQMSPLLGGGHMIDRVFEDHSTWADPPAKFEAGTIPIVQAIALRPAIELVRETGFAAIHAHEQSLLVHAMDSLNEIPGLKIYGPAPEHKGAIVSFTLEGAHPQDLAFLLNRHGVCVRHGHHCTMLLHDHLGISASVRASFAAYNTHEEVDKLVEAIRAARKRLRLE